MYSVIPVWIVEDDKGNQFGTYYTNEEANRVRSVLVKASELAESAQDTDSTETVEAAAMVDTDELVKRQIIDTEDLTAVQPMADLSGPSVWSSLTRPNGGGQVDPDFDDGESLWNKPHLAE
jgi:hypothetical protein